MTEQDSRLGIVLMISATLVFSLQDGISRHLASTYNVLMIVMIRYWFFAAFVIVVAARRGGGLRRVMASQFAWLQIGRAVLLAGEIVVTVIAFVKLGLVQAHAVFASYPLMIAALAGPVLGEMMGWRRWVAVGIGFVGVLIILEPGYGVFAPQALIAVAAALMFALYGLMTRYVARGDSAETSFFYTGVVGCVVMTAVGLPFWGPLSAPDWGWMALLCVTGATGHYLLIRAYELAEAGAIQPFAYLQLVFASSLGVLVFGDTLELNVVIGGAIVVAAGLFTLLRAQRA